jgi:hypothetical protein
MRSVAGLVAIQNRVYQKPNIEGLLQSQCQLGRLPLSLNLGIQAEGILG